jgi:hypothetical protein
MSTNRNTENTWSDKRVAAIELHDSRLETIILHKNGTGEIHFGHLNVFIEESLNHYGVWSFRANLLLHGITQICLDKLIGESEYVVDGQLVAGDGSQITLQSPIDWINIDTFTLVFSSSATLRLKASSIQLCLVAPLKRLEEWIGPLTAS